MIVKRGREMKKILCMLPVTPEHKARLEKAAEGCEFVYTSEHDATAEQIAEANVIIGGPTPELIKASPKLELLQLNMAGADRYVKPGVLAETTKLTNATGAYSKAVAEHAATMLFMLQKKLHLYRDAQKRHEWADFGTVGTISDCTVLVVGLGDIGCHFARIIKALGGYVIGVKRRESAKADCVDEQYTMDKLDELLPRADVVFSVLPGTSATMHMYTAERFKLMKKSAIFINCGRGNAVDNSVLYDALTGGDIAMAGIDVSEVEPLPAESPLWALDNLMITPHVSGYYHLPYTFERIVDIAEENLGHWLRGEELKNIVDFATGYKK